MDSGTESIAVPGLEAPAVINRYVVERGDAKSIVFYWYQSHRRVIASEYAGKLWLVADAIRYRRSDTALVRIVVPIREDNTYAADQSGIRFLKALFPSLLRQLPS